MRRAMWIGVLLLVILAGIGIGVGAYNAGLREGLEESGRAVEVVRVVGHGYGFPFGLILFPLFLIGIFVLVRAAFWHRRWSDHEHGPWGPGPRKGGPAMFEEWHRRQHEQGPGDRPGSGGEPATA